jgi:ElaB/YqjD/DUF883 family membrane-anchored ribosome-binding protein
MEKNKQSRRNFMKTSAVGASVFGLDFSMPSWLFSTNTKGEAGNALTVGSDITFIRENITLTQQLLKDIVAKQNIPSSVNFITVRLVATTITLSENIKIEKNIQFMLIANDINGNGKTIDVSDLKINPDASVTGYTPKDCYFYAKRLNNLTINALGAQGGNGKDSTINFKMLDSGAKLLGRPDKFEAPGTGQNGGNGGNGGAVHITFTESNNATINSTGGKGGVGGRGGNPGNYCAEYDLANPKTTKVVTQGSSGGISRPGGLGGGGKPGSSGGTTVTMETYYNCLRQESVVGRSGNFGANGKDGLKDVKKVSNAVWYTTANSKCPSWSDYRVKLAEYYYRSVNNPEPETIAPQLTNNALMRNRYALIQVFEALALNPNNVTAKLWKTRIYNGHTPIGIQRDVDTNPDFEGFQSEYLKLYGIVQTIQNQANLYALGTNMESGFQTVLKSEQSMLQAFRDSIGKQLDSINLKMEGKDKERKARLSKDTQFNMAIKARQQAIADQPFSLNDLATTIGAVAGVVMAVYSGGTSLISTYKNFMVLGEKTSDFMNALDSIDSLRDIGIEIGEYKNLSHPKSLEGLSTNPQLLKGDRTLSDAPLANSAFSMKNALSKFNADTNKIVNSGKSVIFNMEEISNTIKHINTPDNELNRLFQEKSENWEQIMVLNKELALLELDRDLAKSQYIVFDNSAAKIQQSIDERNPNKMAKEFSFMLQRATYYMDMLSRFVFFSVRSLEILQFKDLSSQLRFDIGHPHPDLIEDANYFQDNTKVQALSTAFNRSWAEFATVIQLATDYRDFKNQPWTTFIIRRSFKGDAINHLKANAAAVLNFVVSPEDAELTSLKLARIEGIKVAYIGAKINNSSSTEFNTNLFQSGLLSQRIAGTNIQRMILGGRTDNIPDANISALPPSVNFKALATQDRSVFSQYELFVSPTQITTHGIDFSNLTEVQVAISVKYLIDGGANFRTRNR